MRERKIREPIYWTKKHTKKNKIITENNALEYKILDLNYERNGQNNSKYTNKEDIRSYSIT